MKILHTSDLHLTDNNPERWDALKKIISLCEREKVNALVISGDLFDADADALKLKAKIRGIFTNLPFDIYLIPGNHDSSSFEDRAFFGSNVRILRNRNDIIDLGGITITGIRFGNISERALYAELQNISASLDPGKINILLFHGELIDSYYSRRDFGEEGESRYMPARLGMFENLNFNYILAGHFHTNFNIWEFNPCRGKGFFVYPGSPVSITRRETGRRKANLFECGEPPCEMYLDTEYYETVTVALDPMNNDDPVTFINRSISAVKENAKIILKVGGYLNSEKHGIDETALNDFLEKTRMENLNIIECVFNAADMKTIIEDSVYKAFIRKLDEKNYDKSLNAGIKDTFLKAMIESKI